MATVDRRTFVGATIALAATAALPPLVLGQDAATPEAATESPLSGLGLPTLEATVGNDATTFAGAATAGTTLLTVTNASDGFATFLLVQPPADVTADDIAASIGPDVPMPDWLHEAVVTGSLDLEPGQVGSVGIELTAGAWLAVNAGDAASMTDLNVEGEFAEAAIDANAEILMSHHLFDIPAEMAAGPQVWQVTNEDPVLHHMIVFTYPEQIDAEQFVALLMATEGMASPPADLDPMQLMFVTATGLQSQGVTNWWGLNLAPGFYQAACFIADPGGEVPHVAQGMAATFTVS